jgi:hypothetical protein
MIKAFHILNEALKKHIIGFVIAGLSLIAAIYFFGFFLFQSYFYFKNGAIVELERYYIELPFPTWYILSSDELGYTITTEENDYIDFLKTVEEPNKLDPNLLLKPLNVIKTTYKRYPEVEGIEYLCLNEHNEYLLYFLSNDMNFYFLKYPHIPNEIIEKKLDLLLNSVKKKL